MVSNKIAGALFGSGAAILGLFAYTEFNRVDDETLLVSFLNDHCIPFADTGQVPFQGIGMAAEPDDLAILGGRFVSEIGNIAILSEGRFEAAWGEIESGDGPVRACQVMARPDGDDLMGFAVAPRGFIEVLTEAISPDGRLIPETDEITEGTNPLGWYEQNGGPTGGLRVVLMAQPGEVLSLLVVNDIED